VVTALWTEFEKRKFFVPTGAQNTGYQALSESLHRIRSGSKISVI